MISSALSKKEVEMAWGFIQSHLEAPLAVMGHLADDEELVFVKLNFPATMSTKTMLKVEVITRKILRKKGVQTLNFG